MLVIPKLSGVFDRFVNLDEISLESIKRWVKFPIEEHILENFIANRMLYPQTIPMTEQEMEIDLAVLREAVRMNIQMFYDPVKSSLVIPEEFSNRFPPLIKLVSALIDVLTLKEVTRIYVKSWVATRLVGSIVLPKNLQHADVSIVTLGTKQYKVEPHSLTQIASSNKMQLLTVDSYHIGVAGGEYGVFIDLRLPLVNQPQL